MIRCVVLSVVAGACLASPVWGQPNVNRAYEAELLGDAQLRASLLADPPSPSSGWTKGKFTMTDGGANTLNIGGFNQTRFLSDFRDNQPDPNDVTTGFQLRRTRLIASGTVWDKNLSFQIVGEFSRSNGNFGLLDAFAKYAWDNGMYVRWGQYKLGMLREENVSDIYQLTVERSAMNSVFNQSRSQGVELGYADKQFRVMGSFSDGFNTLNTDFDSSAEADFALTGRAEWIFAGEDFKRFDDFTSWQESSFAAMLGGAIHYQSGGETGGTLDISFTEATLDLSLEGNGWNAFVEGVWRNFDPVSGNSTDDFGVVAQAGVFLTNQLELFGRYDVIIPDVGDNFNTVTAGMTYYVSPRSHAVKFTGDVVYYIDPQSDTPILSPNTGLPLLADSEGDQVAIRLQMQLVF